MRWGGRDGGWTLRRNSGQDHRWRQKLNDGRYESGHRKQQPNSSGAKEFEAKEKMTHITEGLVFSVCRENTSTKGVFVLLNDHTICSVFTQTVPGSLGETDSTPERWEMILHSHRSLVAPFLSQSESLRRDILSETRQTHSMAYLNGEFNNLKPTRSSMSKKAWKKDLFMKYWCSSNSVIRMTSARTRWTIEVNAKFLIHS